MNRALDTGSVLEFSRTCQLTVQRVVYSSAETGRSLLCVHNHEDGLSYALKVFRLDSDDIAAVRRETIALNRQNQHPHRLPRFRGLWVEGERAFVLLDWMEGVALDALTGDRAARSVSELLFRLEILLEACRTTALLHEKGFVHRDLKPQNLLLRDPRRPADGIVIIDFGLSTQPRGLVEGSYGFSAPEQVGVRNLSLGPTTDVFSIAQVGYYLCTGRPRDLVLGEGALDWSQRGPTLTELLPEVPIPAGLQPVLDRALALQPKQRYPHAGAFAHQLQPLLRRRG